MLFLLKRLGEVDLIERFVTEITAAGCYKKADNGALIAALRRLPSERRIVMIERIIDAVADRRFAACAELLTRAVSARATPSPLDLATAASRLVEKLPGEADAAAPLSFSARKDEISPDFIAETLAGLSAIDATLAERAVQHVLAFPKRYDLDTILVPALRKAKKERAVRTSAAFERLRAVCLDHLRTRMAEPLEPPADWRRARSLRCSCADCAVLARFLDDPGRPEWTYKAAEVKRRHVETTIKCAQADDDLKTERSGSPHSLICTKNQASYERRVQHRKRDLDNLRALASADEADLVTGDHAAPSS